MRLTCSCIECNVCSTEVLSLSERSRLEVNDLVSSVIDLLLAFFQILVVLGAGFAFSAFRQLSAMTMS